ncbi:TPA: TIGR02646 family protein [Escherichia coli]|jgi:TIGR02646 family protein|uniref:retron system putative HNH endonuclease n=1 Tax=Escherichia coli TaxID=562 RepID=UPI001D3CB769|nr:TIGR02646 family protein [Escherichia coli]HCS5607284.1 TIGR02646 family protein [Escherichia coli]HCW2811139.1 TIGR02646 family protein [Escherichia coli]HDL0261025.1 TIGR02646 family protein [Escherichia coli]HDL0323304.1 TIGR02646 family protein [Escherichia coli]
MIKLNRLLTPVILRENRNIWTKNLMDLVNKYGGYKKIPTKEKESALRFYRHEDIKRTLKASTHGKCAFCEGIPDETGYAEVEHFYPKSLYTERTFEWENLLYCCKQCNNKKLNHDTYQYPIVNPYDNDPNDYFTYMDIMIKPKEGPLHEIADRTIRVCGLTSSRLISARSEILVTFRIFEQDLSYALDEFHDAITEKNKEDKARKIITSLETIESMAKPNAKLSHFYNFLLNSSEVYRQAKDELDKYTRDVL